MKDKLKNLLLPGSLMIAVIISLILSVSLLTNPARFSGGHHQKNSATSNSSISASDLRGVYAPTQLIHTATNKDQHLMTSPTTNLVGEIFKQMGSYHYSNIKQVTKNNQKRYFKILNSPNSLMLNYNEPISSDMVGCVLNYNGFKNKGDVNRIILPLGNDKHVYLLSDNGFRAYRVDVKKRNLNKVKEVINHDVTKNDVEMRLLNKRPYVYFPNKVQNRDYGYLLKEGSQSSYLSRIIGNTTKASISKTKGYTTYNAANQELSFGGNGQVIYKNYHNQNRVKNQKEALEAAYRNAVQLGVPMRGTKFNSYSHKDNMVDYRFFIEGAPIYSSSQLGDYAYKSAGNKERYDFSLRDFQIPVPTDNEVTTLPSTKRLFAELKANGVNLKNIKDVKIAYQVDLDNNNYLLATLKSTWLLKINNKWINYRQLVPTNDTGKDNF